MPRRLLAALAALSLIAGCAGPTKLAEKSQQKLESGDMWRAWQLAVRALEREPLNPTAKSAAAAAGHAIATDWERRIAALASVDSLRAADQVLEYASFRGDAARYVTVDVSPTWPARDKALRNMAARTWYADGARAAANKRPKAAYDAFVTCERYVTPYRDATKRRDAAYDRAVTRIAVVPFASPSDPEMGAAVAEQWRDAIAQQMQPPAARFTRVLGSDAITAKMTVAQLGRLSREEAVKLGRKAGADRVVWGTLGGLESETKLLFFKESVARRIVTKNSEGQSVTRWVSVPIEVVARVRDVNVTADVEVLSTESGASLSHRRIPRSTSARVVWTSYVPEGELDRYALVTDEIRANDPDRAKAVESRWKSVVGDGVTLAQVLSARRETRGEARYDRGSLGRFAMGTAFVFLQELPPANDLARAALMKGWSPLGDELARLDGIDDVDLGVALDHDE